MNNVADVTLLGNGYYNRFGTCVSDAGDVNGDGFSDVISCANLSGSCYVFLGGSNMNNIYDVILAGNGEGKYASNAGDINLDGYSDIILSEYGYNGYTGRANIYYGGMSMNSIEDVSFEGNISGVFSEPQSHVPAMLMVMDT